MTKTFNNRIRQIILLAIITIIALVLIKQLYTFLPGFLGAVTMYILLRGPYHNLTIKKQWHKTRTALLFVITCLVCIAVPLVLSIQLLTSKVMQIVNNPEQLINNAQLVITKLEAATNTKLLSPENLDGLRSQAAKTLPTVLNSSLIMVANIGMLFFLLFFLLKDGRTIEKFLDRFIPLKDENIDLIALETKSIIKANAIGIPVLAIAQGIVAIIGYLIFGVSNAVLYGFITGIMSLVPVVGTALIWVPMVAYLYATGNSGMAIGLLIYCAVVLTNIDYVIRLTFLKQFIDIHPLITILGVIVGVGLFGFWGVIFGPLLISYFIILSKVYLNEFGTKKTINTQ
jgi:predicted PurR-regulated permease PerM